ncbi:FtsP/CotA-like multicopper oxidase with cupredoxin domain [Actinoplanes abujensis]|uniref:FtsP/CotA-like multicopper oxidase with cupredoxin domain n=1 Tax=Paractinoplanes abujensis TaxID=882441 RepID=A0A7W7G0Z5_9ACTN|nr:multicopper oxidase family protein [Actinoplanes abujensis]MBB4692152.1 FtsP/CotA-like multicopper oxidase with cupredoxin domain [Actinoplanes abujensis]
MLIAAGWLGAGAAAAAGRRPIALGSAALALTATTGRALTIVALVRAGWWFGAEKVLIAGPLLAAGMAVAVAALLRRRAESVALMFAGYAATAAVLVTVLHGYPVSAGVALFAVSGIAAATAVTWRVLGARSSPRASRTAGAVAVAALVAGTGLAASAGATPVSPHRHVPVAGPAVGEPTKRFTFEAGRTTVDAGGRKVRAWAFNGQVPGPEIAATVGDIIEVTLRNRDIDRGVTLHWHGYDVPNDQDGVPDVTQAAVLPGQQFVYRFRADQAGTYWYHTHSASDVGVRMGLYGVLVVRPRAATGVDVVVPVHRLSGHDLPAAFVTAAGPGAPVRLRLINTDSITHRYAVTGAPFRVAAIDGMDLRDPPPLAGEALSIPAGGRYDVVTTAAAALSVDGRRLWSAETTVSGMPPSATLPADARSADAHPGATRSAEAQPDATRSAATQPAATDRWPVFDPLTYGTPSRTSWSQFDRSFTLVLDRGVDLRGLLPRYAHTVNGAADPDIPVQFVRRGDIVKFTIVNRSLVVHPWHLHGHHVLVLARNGQAATGSPLWLDSFDVRPGEVWEVAFEADNPGMWANHCHNLPHADAGMMLHLAYE